MIMTIRESIRGPRHRRGTAMTLVIIISVVITGLIMTIAWSGGIQAQSAANRTRTDEGFYAAEGGLQWAIYEMRQNPAWRPAAISPIINGWTCAISYTDLGTPTGILGNPLQFVVKASKTGTIATGKSIATVTGVLAYAPQFWSLGNLSIAQSAQINGDVETLGGLTINAPTTGGVILKGAKGTWKAKGAVTDNNPSGSPNYFTYTPQGNQSVTPPVMTAANMFATMKAGATTPMNNVLTINPATGNFVIDFSLAGGKPVYIASAASYNGNVEIKSSSNPSNDTLLIDGSATFTGTFPANIATAPMNLVVNGDVLFNGSGAKGIAIIGSLYVSGNWNQTGMYNFKGTIMTDKVTTLAGTGIVNVAVPPAFDPRYVPRITGYVGNLP